MTIQDIVDLFASSLEVPVLLTDAQISDPGPTIQYVNPAFSRMSGYDAHQLVGKSPRLLQGEKTNPLALRAFAQALRQGQPFHGCLDNYRRSGEPYLCEIVAWPVTDDGGAVCRFIALEREVARRRGRPSKRSGRFQPVEACPDRIDEFFRNAGAVIT